MDPISDTIPVTTDPVWPWSIPNVGWIALGVTAALLLGTAAWSYLRVPGANLGRVGVVLTLRVLALFLIFLALMGASCVSRDELKVPSLVIIGLDLSESMGLVKDESEGRSRYEQMLRVLADARPTIEKLKRDHNISVVFYRFGDEVAEFDPDNPVTPTGKRTDTAQLLKTLYEKYRGEKYLRALLIHSDGADNVASDPPARVEAARWRSLPCPVHTFAYGSKAAGGAYNDIVVTALSPDPPTVAVKGKLAVVATIDAFGFINRDVRVKVFINDKEVAAQDETLRQRKDNRVQIVVDAPADPGEIKLTFKVHRPDKAEALVGEMSAANNEMSTYVTVSREGLSVLLVERLGRYAEPQMILSALSADKRIRVYRAWLTGDTLVGEDQKGLFQFDQQPYDVIILGDVTAARLKSADRDALDKIYDRVFSKRTGLMMMGGRHAFANGDWADTPIAKLLPVKLDKPGQVSTEVQMMPTAEGLRYVLRLADREKDSEEKWGRMPELDGYTPLGSPLGRERVFAQTAGGEPLLVAHDYGTGRVMAFAADTTRNWVVPRGKDKQPIDGAEVHSRFWRQVVLWLARQEDTDDNLRVRLDTRRLRTGDNLGFGVELRGKQGETLKGAKYQVRIVHEKGNESAVEVLPGVKGAGENEYRGGFKPKLAGEYKVVASGSGQDAAGKTVSGNAKARFLAYQDDAETTEKAANPDFLKELAAAGGGQDHRPEQLKKFLESLPSKPLPQPPPKPKPFPNWRTSKGPDPFLVAFFLLFVQVLALEWFLRRRWGMI